MNYFAIGHFNAAGGVQVTASHNPAQYNGFKFSRHGARPVSGDHGIALMESKIQEGDLPKAATPGKVTQGEVFRAYQHHVTSFLREGSYGQPLKVVADAANGMGTIERPILEAMGIELTTLYYELDGTFPNHEANPLKEENLLDLQRAVREAGADLGISFDGDADRAAFIDETGEPIGSDLMTGLVGGILLEREPGKVVVYDLRSSRAVAEYIQEKGGIPMRERVGHSFIKATMRQHEAIFGGELAGHYYFRDHSYADCPLLTVVEVLNLMRQKREPRAARRRIALPGGLGYPTYCRAFSGNRAREGTWVSGNARRVSLRICGPPVRFCATRPGSFLAENGTRDDSSS
jgi:phosphomannomutase